MTPRVTAPLLAAPLGAIAVAGALAVARALDAQTGALPAQRTVSTLVLLVVAALVLRAASGRASASERPLRGVAIASMVLGVWLVVLEWVLPAHVAFAGSIEGPQLRGLANVGFQLPWVLALAWAVPHLVRAAVSSTPQAPVGAGWVLAALAAGTAAAFGLVGDATQTLGIAGLGRAAGLTALGLALVLLLLDRPLAHGNAPPPGTQLGVMADGQNPSPAAFALGFVLGAAAIAWGVLVRPFVGGPLAATSLVGTIVFGAMAMGALVGAWLARRVPRPDLRLLLGLAVTAYLALLSLPLLDRLPLALLQAGGEAAARDAALRNATVLALGPTALVAGITLLLGVRVRCDWTGAASSSAGLLVTWTVAGVVVGAGLGRLLLLPRATPALVLLAGAGLAIVVAAGLRLRAQHAPRALFALLTIVPLGVLLWPGIRTEWTATEPTPAVVRAATRPLPLPLVVEDAADIDVVTEWFSGRTPRTRPSGAALPRMSGFDGPLALIAQPDGELRIEQAGRLLGLLGADADPADARIEVALGLVPAVLHPNPTRALVLGPGSGLAVEALLASRLARVHVVAPVPAALDLARAYRSLDAGVLANPRVTPHVTGARTFLPAGDAKPTRGATTYDVIAAGLPFDPALFAEAGIAGVRGALAEDGIAAFHLPFEGLDADALRRVLATMRTQFDTVWLMRFRNHLLALCATSIDIGGGRWSSVLADGASRTDPPPSARLARRAGLGTRGRVLGHLVLDTQGVDRILPLDGPRLSDDKPWFAHRLEANRRAARDPRAELGGVIDVGFPPRLEALVPDPRRRDAWIAAIVEGWLEEDAFVAGVWDGEVRYGSTPAGWRARARAASARGEPEQAVRFYDLALKSAKDKSALTAEKIEALAEAVMSGRVAGGEARDEVLRIGAAFPRDGVVLAAVGRARHRFGDLGGARAALEAALKQTTPPPPDGTALLLGRVLLASGDPDEARIRTLMESDPALYESADALDLYLGRLSPKEHAKRAPDLELVIQTLRREAADRLAAGARAHVARGAFEAGFADAQGVTDLVGDRASGHELLAVVLLGRAATAPDDARRAAFQRAAGTAFVRAREVSLARERTMERARQLAALFGMPMEFKDQGGEAK